MTAFPFRTELRTLSEPEIARTNREMARGGESRYLSYERERPLIRRALGSGREIPRERLERWMRHPDERVPCALVEDARGSVTFGWVLLPHALAAAREEEVLWTPLLDALARTALPRFGSAPMEGWVQQLESEARRSAEWLQGIAEAGSLLPLASFDSGLFLRQVAQWAGKLSVPVLENLFATPDHWPLLARNRNLGPEAVRWLTEGLLRELSAQAAEPRDAERWWRVERAITAFSLLEVQGRQVPGKGVNALLGWLEESYGRPFSQAYPAGAAAVHVLARWPTLGAPRLMRLYRVLCREGFDRDSIAPLVESPSATAELWETLLEHHGRSPVVRLALARSSRARSHPPVLRALATSRSPEVLAPLLEGAGPGEFASLFRRLARLDPEALLPVLEDAGEEQWAEVEREDLAPLLSSSSEQIRLAAIRLLPRLRCRHEPGKESKVQGPCMPSPPACSNPT